MTTSEALPYDSNVIFPDNGIISQAYDLRVSQNDMLRVGQKIMHQQPAYVREENLFGEGIYTWEPDFIKMIDESFSTGIRGNFSKEQYKIFNDYMLYVKDGTLIPATSESILALDLYLGSR